MARLTHVKVSTVWKEIEAIYTRVSGTWKKMDNAWVRAGGAFKYTHLEHLTATVATSTSNYNLFTAVGSPSHPVHVTLTVNSGVILYAPAPGNVGLTISGFHASSFIHLINNGNIKGDGGNGGTGATGTGANGTAGGTAINIRDPITITNGAGFIFGGGAGGKGGNGASNCTVSGGGGGGGASSGALDSQGGGVGSPSSGGQPVETAQPGSLGTQNGGGAGGVRGGCQYPDPDPPDPEMVGEIQDHSSAGANGGAHGNGKAIDTNGNAIIWISGNTGSRVKGAVSA